MHFRFRRRLVRHVVFHVDLNPHGFNEAERAAWLEAMCALHAFRPDARGGAK